MGGQRDRPRKPWLTVQHEQVNAAGRREGGDYRSLGWNSWEKKMRNSENKLRKQRGEQFEMMMGHE